MARIKTEQEKEFERLPFCSYDPLNSRCETPDYPPTQDHCERCITISVSDALMANSNSDAMRWFIAYKNFVKLKDEKK